jgi:hypothetical protein
MYTTSKHINILENINGTGNRSNAIEIEASNTITRVDFNILS